MVRDHGHNRPFSRRGVMIAVLRGSFYRYENNLDGDVYSYNKGYIRKKRVFLLDL
jgi:hypothetical protein